jgi:hypothetical protein
MGNIMAKKLTIIYNRTNGNPPGIRTSPLSRTWTDDASSRKDCEQLVVELSDSDITRIVRYLAS